MKMTMSMKLEGVKYSMFGCETEVPAMDMNFDMDCTETEWVSYMSNMTEFFKQMIGATSLCVGGEKIDIENPFEESSVASSNSDESFNEIDTKTSDNTDSDTKILNELIH